MKKICNKYIVSIIAILVIIIALVSIINIVGKNKKIIFYSYEKINGFLLTKDTIIIYDDGSIERVYEVEDNDEKYRYRLKLPKEQSTKIKEIITNIENSELYIEENVTLDKLLYDDIEKYININKKIILNDNNTKCTNKYIEELDKKVEEIKQEYLK